MTFTLDLPLIFQAIVFLVGLGATWTHNQTRLKELCDRIKALEQGREGVIADVPVLRSRLDATDRTLERLERHMENKLDALSSQVEKLSHLIMRGYEAAKLRAGT